MYSDPSGLAPKKEKREAGLLVSESILQLIALAEAAKEDHHKEMVARINARCAECFDDWEMLKAFSRWQVGGKGAFSNSSYRDSESFLEKGAKEVHIFSLKFKNRFYIY